MRGKTSMVHGGVPGQMTILLQRTTVTMLRYFPLLSKLHPLRINHIYIAVSPGARLETLCAD